MGACLLPVKIPNDLSAVFFYALPAACLCGDPDYADWYHMNYLDFYGYKNTANREKYEFRFVDAVSYVDRGRAWRLFCCFSRFFLRFAGRERMKMNNVAI